MIRKIARHAFSLLKAEDVRFAREKNDKQNQDKMNYFSLYSHIDMTKLNKLKLNDVNISYSEDNENLYKIVPELSHELDRFLNG